MLLNVKLPKGCWIRDVNELTPTAIFRILSYIMIDNGNFCVSQVYVSNANDNVLKRINDHENVFGVKVLGRLGSTMLIKVYHRCPLASVFIKALMSPTVPFDVECCIAKWILAPDETSNLRILKRELKLKGIKTMLRKDKSKFGLTPRQRYVLIRAVEEGYYDYPRRITLSQLAEKIGISKSSLSEILMKIESKVLSNLVY